MKTPLRFAIVAAVALAGVPFLHSQGTAFTYQGRLAASGVPANGAYDFQFTLFDAPSGGAVTGNPTTNTAVVVSNGVFSTTLDFGNAFTGAGRWLDIAVRTNGAGAFTPISPRQALTPTPYAITAGRVVSGGIPGGTYGSAVTFSNAANNFTGTFAGDGSRIANVNAATLDGQPASNLWQLGGNNVSAGQFVGSTNGQALELRAGGLPAMRLVPGASGDAANVIGGSSSNFVAPGLLGATIAGGGAPPGFFSAPNSVSASFATVGGGLANRIDPAALYGTIAGGFANTMADSAQYSVVGGGFANSVAASALSATVPGGEHNVAGGFASFAAGRRARAMHSGTFVWADPQDQDFTSSAVNQFLVRASGGMGINTTNPAATLDVNGSLRVGAGTTIFRNLQGGVAQMSGGSFTVKTNFTFAFPKAFVGVPTVIISPRSGNASPVDDTFACTVRDVTVSNCTVNLVRVDNPSGWGQSVKIDWLAWE